MIRKRTMYLMMTIFLLLIVIMYPKEPFAAPYYEGKMIRIIVGNVPGGGYDRMARLMAKYLPKYIPGRPSIIIENMEGASSIIAANYIYNVAKQDGLTIGAPERGIALGQLLKVEGIRFDLRKCSWIGSMAVEPSVLAIRSDLPYKTYNDLLKAKAPIIFGCSGPTDSIGQLISLLKEFQGLNCKLIIYPSGAEVQLAVERKEVDGRGYSLNSFRPLMARGTMRPVLRGRTSEPEIEYLPVDEDLTTSKLGKTLMAIRSSQEKIGRPYVAPPGIPTDVINILRDAFAKVAKDPQLQEESKKLMMSVSYTPADACMEMFNFVLNQPEDIVKEFKKYVVF